MSQRRTFDHTTESVGQARRFVGQAIQGVSPEVLRSAVLMVSELASNCIRHTDSRYAVAVIRTKEGIRVEATDQGGGKPVLRNPGPSDPTGRGLQIISMLASDWGVESGPGRGKTVWFTVPGPACRV